VGWECCGEGAGGIALDLPLLPLPLLLLLLLPLLLLPLPLRDTRPPPPLGSRLPPLFVDRLVSIHCIWSC